MKIIFPGTGSGFVSLKRNHASLILKESKNILIDAGDGIVRALLFSNINPLDIDIIIISHFHPDHFSGLASLITQMKLGGRKRELQIFCIKAMLEM